MNFEGDQLNSDIMSIARNIKKEHTSNDLCTEQVKYILFIIKKLAHMNYMSIYTDNFFIELGNDIAITSWNDGIGGCS